METNDPTNEVLERITSLSERQLKSSQESFDEAKRTSQVFLALATFILTVILGLFSTNEDHAAISYSLAAPFLITGYSFYLLLKNFYPVRLISGLNRNALEKQLFLNEVEILEFELSLNMERREELDKISQKKNDRLKESGINLGVSLALSFLIVLIALILKNPS